MVRARTIRRGPPPLGTLPTRETTAAAALQGWLHEAAQESRNGKRSNRYDSLSRATPRAVQLVVALQVGPELGRSPEIAGQAEGRVRRDPPLAGHDFVDPPARHPNGDGELVLRDAEPFDEVFHQDLPRVDRLHQVSRSGSRRLRHCPHLHQSASFPERPTLRDEGDSPPSPQTIRLRPIHLSGAKQRQGHHGDTAPPPIGGWTCRDDQAIYKM